MRYEHFALDPYRDLLFYYSVFLLMHFIKYFARACQRYLKEVGDIGRGIGEVGSILKQLLILLCFEFKYDK